jgi:uncharacterized protein
MKCPACFHELTVFQVGKLSVDACQGGCGGIWFDAFELQRVDEQEEEAGETLLHIEHDSKVVVDTVRKRDCPKCPGVKLHRHFFSAKRRVEVDQCPNCAGYWLDAGELSRIRDERSETAKVQQIRQASISSDVIRYLYRLEAEGRKRL